MNEDRFSDYDLSPDEYMGEDISDEDAVDEAQEYREQLGDIPLGEIKKLKDKVGLKKYNEVLFGVSKQRESGSENIELKREEKIATMNNKKKNVPTISDEVKKKSKSEPLEVSSKKMKFSKPRRVVKDEKRSVRDPRFSDLSGAYNEDLFQKSYSFINEMKEKEYNLLKKQLKKTKNSERKAELLRLKQKLDAEQKLENDKLKRRELKKQRQANMDEEDKSSKRPFYLKKSDQKKIELAEKYRELKTSGKLEKFMMKKRKKNAQKERRNLPKMKAK